MAGRNLTDWELGKSTTGLPVGWAFKSSRKPTGNRPENGRKKEKQNGDVLGRGCCTRDQKEEDDEQWAWGAFSSEVGCNGLGADQVGHALGLRLGHTSGPNI